MRQHVCGQGCNGDIHAELIAEPDEGFHAPTLKRWLGAKRLTVHSFPPIFLDGVGDRRFALVLWQ